MTSAPQDQIWPLENADGGTRRPMARNLAGPSATGLGSSAGRGTPFLMTVIARTYVRAADKKLAASVVERALVDEIKNPAIAI